VVGQTIAHYRILDRLGGGGMGVVYRAQDLKLDREVALKFLATEIASDAHALERFKREARSAAALNHPNICTIYEIGEADGQPYIAMELLEGGTLQEHMAGNALSLDRTLELGAQVADALAAAHAKGIVHRDVKPGNIFITANGLAKVVDFGLAKPASTRRISASAEETHLVPNEHVTAHGSALGTIAYMSPEQARGEEIDPRSDTFSFGVVLYEMATGRQAFGGTTTAVIFDGILNRTPEAPSHFNQAVPPELEGIIARAIEKDRARRYQNVADLATDLKRLRRLSDSNEGAPTPVRRKVQSGWGPAAATPAWRRWWPAAALGALVVVAGVLGLRQTREVEALGESDVIVLADFTNGTGDAMFDGTLKQALAVKLEESPFINVLSQQRVQETLRYMQRPPDTVVTPAVAREICQRQGVKAIMAGDIARLGESYVITLTAEGCQTGDVLAREQVEARSKEAVLSSLGRATSAMRGKLGESLASIEKMDTPINQASTGSLEALKAFSLGDRERMARGDIEALAFFKRAVELDPEFALAHARLGTVYANLGESALSREHRETAYALRDKVSERERLYITAHYFASVESDPAKAADVYELWKKTYPRDATPYTNVGLIYSQQGNDDRALESYLQSIDLEPASSFPYTNAASIYVNQGRFDEAEALLEKLLERSGGSPAAHVMLYGLAARKGDTPAMETHAAAVRGTPAEAEVLGVQAERELFAGHVAEFRRLTEEAAGVASRYGLLETARAMEGTFAWVDALLGFSDRARAEAQRAIAGPPSPKVTRYAAMALAAVGDIAAAERAYATVREDALKMGVEGAVQDAVFRALVALQRGRPSEALERLESVRAFEARWPAQLGSRLLRGRAYLAAGQPGEAERELAEVLTRRNLQPFDVVHILALFDTGRARAAAGNAKGAREAYTQVVELWKDADADLPLLKDARAALDRLQTN
jgi:tetratricopeptide (TPR) repeat protein